MHTDASLEFTIDPYYSSTWNTRLAVDEVVHMPDPGLFESDLDSDTSSEWTENPPLTKDELAELEWEHFKEELEYYSNPEIWVFENQPESVETTEPSLDDALFYWDYSNYVKYLHNTLL